MISPALSPGSPRTGESLVFSYMIYFMCGEGLIERWLPFAGYIASKVCLFFVVLAPTCN